jgi:hypothetical protein
MVSRLFYQARLVRDAVLDIRSPRQTGATLVTERLEGGLLVPVTPCANPDEDGELRNEHEDAAGEQPDLEPAGFQFAELVVSHPGRIWFLVVARA